MKTLLSALPHVFVPLTIIISAISVTGFLGNGLALYVFHFRFPSTGFNKLLATLALYDVLACTVHMPLDIATFLPVGSARSSLCKITCFQLAFTSTGTAIILLAIAIVRFYGIHKPFAGLFSTKSAGYVLVISVLTASGIGLPITFLFGAGELKMDSNVTTEICAVEERFSDTVGPISYYSVLAGLYLVTLFFHTLLYVMSVVTVWNRRRMFVTVKGNQNTVMMTSSSSGGVHHATMPGTAGGTSPSTHLFQRQSNDRQCNTGSHENGISYLAKPPAHSSMAGNPTYLLQADQNDTIDSKTGKEMKRKQLKPTKSKRQTTQTSSANMVALSKASTLPVRGTVMTGNSVNQTGYRVLALVIAISIAFFLSYAPHFVVMFYLFTHDKDVFTESAQSLVFELLMRSFFLNSFLDPVIYGLMSAEFRKEAKRTLRRFFCIRCRR